MIVEVPGVGVVEFPDGTPPDVIQKAIESMAAPKGPTKSSAVDALTQQAMDAYAAGDDAGGKRLLTEANRMAIQSGQVPEGFVANPQTGGFQDLPNDPSIPTGQAVAAGVGAMQGFGYNLGDEAIGGLSALTGGDYQYGTERAREMERRAREGFPVTFGGAQIGGAVGSSLGMGQALGLGNAMKGTLAQRSAAGAGLGLGEGALAGAGAGQSAEERIKNAGLYGALGAGVGGVAPAALQGIGTALGVIPGAVASMRTAPSSKRASEAIKMALDRSGKSAQEIDDLLRQAATEGQPMFTVADAMGNSGQRALSGAARIPGSARTTIADALTSRQDSQGARVGSFIADALGAKQTAAQTEAAMTAARGGAADVAYDAARKGAGPVDIRGALSVIDDRLGPMAGSGIADDGIAGRLAKYRGRLATSSSPKFPGATSVELSDFDSVLRLKQEVGDDIGAAVRAGRNNEARELGKVQAALDEALQTSSPAYRSANDEFARASREIGAIDKGKSAASARVRYQDTADMIKALTAPEKQAAAVGYADPLLATIDKSAPGVNKARPLLADKPTAELGMMAKDPALLRRQIERENTMFQTTNAALGGSKTADNLADQADMKAFDAGPLLNMFSNPKTAALQIGSALMNTAKGRNTATQELIAKMLMGQDINSAIAPALAKEAAAGPRRAIAEAIMRSLMAPGR